MVKSDLEKYYKQEIEILKSKNDFLETELTETKLKYTRLAKAHVKLKNKFKVLEMKFMKNNEVESE